MNQVDETPNNWERIADYVVVGSIVVLTVVASVGLALVLCFKFLSCA
jgi:hypothetical protein